MTYLLILGGIASGVLGLYLLVALLFPEKMDGERLPPSRAGRRRSAAEPQQARDLTGGTERGDVR